MPACEDGSAGGSRARGSLDRYATPIVAEADGTRRSPTATYIVNANRLRYVC